MQTPSFTPTDLNDGFVVAITIEAKPGDEDSVATILDVMVEPTMRERVPFVPFTPLSTSARSSAPRAG